MKGTYGDYDYDGGLSPALTPPNDAPSLNVALGVAIPIVCLGLISALIISIMKYCHNMKMNDLKAKFNPLKVPFVPWDRTTQSNMSGPGGDTELLGTRVRPVGDSTLREFGGLEDAMTSGSGSGKKCSTCTALGNC